MRTGVIGLIFLLLAAPNTEVGASGAMMEWSVHVALQVDSDGRVTGCEVLDSDAPSDLQASTCRTLVKTAKFTPKHDADGHVIAAVYKTVVRYRMPGNAAPAQPSPSLASAQSDALHNRFSVGDWSGACRKADTASPRFEECEAHFAQADVSATIRRTYGGIEIFIRSPNCGTTEPVGRASVTRGELQFSGETALTDSLAGAILAGKQKCPALPMNLRTSVDFNALLAVTANLEKPR